VTPAVAASSALAGSASGFQRRLLTPEGIELNLRLASAAERAGAFLLDLVIMGLTLTVLTIVIVILAIQTGVKGPAAVEALAILWLIGFFLLRNFYFVLFELGARAATPGKRVVGVRVIARDGGRLSGEAVFTRNALREVEAFLPITLILGAGAAGDAAGALIVLTALIWTGCLLLFPLFNRDRMRPGDLVAGTWVVKAVRPALLKDMAAESIAAPQRFVFTPDQLDAYGVKELELLEGVLRRIDRRVMALVAERIRGRIGWAQRPDEGDLDFLTAYYGALRGRLEQRLLFGRRRRDKFDV
jgi:uncharacterized RDD family membrane protein YckC